MMGSLPVIISLRVAAIASVMAAVVCTPIMAQTTGTIPPQSPSPEVTPSSPPPTGSQFSSNELINAGSHFFGGVSHGLAMIVEKAVSQWGLPNGYVKRPAVPLSVASAMATVALYEKCRRSARVLARAERR